MGSKASKAKKREEKTAKTLEKAAKDFDRIMKKKGGDDCDVNDELFNPAVKRVSKPGKPLVLRQDSVAYNKTAIQKRKDAENRPGKVREGASTEDLLETINSNKTLKSKLTSVCSRHPCTFSL